MGSVIFSVADIFGNSADRNQTVLQYRANLNFITSFTGHDALITSVFAGNAPLRTSFNLPGVETPSPLGFNVPIETAEGTLSSQFAGNTNNSLEMLALQYIFPVGDRLVVDVTSCYINCRQLGQQFGKLAQFKQTSTGIITKITFRQSTQSR